TAACVAFCALLPSAHSPRLLRIVQALLVHSHRFMVSTRSSSELRLLFGRFRRKATSASGCLTIAVYEYTHQVVLTKVVVFSTNDLVDDRLCVLIPMLCPTAVTNPEGDFGTTKDIGPLAETDPFIASGDVATLAKIAALQVVCVG